MNSSIPVFRSQYLSSSVGATMVTSPAIPMNGNNIVDIPIGLGKPPQLRGETVDQVLGDEVYDSNFPFRPNEWLLVGFEWGRAGKKIFVDGISLTYS